MIRLSLAFATVALTMALFGFTNTLGPVAEATARFFFAGNLCLALLCLLISCMGGDPPRE